MQGPFQLFNTVFWGFFKFFGEFNQVMIIMMRMFYFGHILKTKDRTKKDKKHDLKFSPPDQISPNPVPPPSMTAVFLLQRVHRVCIYTHVTTRTHMESSNTDLSCINTLLVLLNSY